MNQSGFTFVRIQVAPGRRFVGSARWGIVLCGVTVIWLGCSESTRVVSPAALPPSSPATSDLAEESAIDSKRCLDMNATFGATDAERERINGLIAKLAWSQVTSSTSGLPDPHDASESKAEACRKAAWTLRAYHRWAFPNLSKHLEDKTKSTRISEAAQGETVGDACYAIIHEEILPLPRDYRHFVGDRMGRDRQKHPRPLQAATPYDAEGGLRAWLAARSDRSLNQMRLECFRWLLDQEKAIGANDPEDYLTHILPIELEVARLRRDIGEEVADELASLEEIAKEGWIDQIPPELLPVPVPPVESALRITISDDMELVFRRIEPARYGIDYPAYYMLETEVTNAQYKVYLDATSQTKNDTDVLAAIKRQDESSFSSTADPSYSIKDPSAIWRDGFYPEGLDDHPVALLTPEDAAAFAAWLENKHGEQGAIRLPTWNEWMIAAYGKSRAFPWGNRWYANRLHSSHTMVRTYDLERRSRARQPPIRTEPVMARPFGQSPEGIHGLLGNVSEFIVDGDATNDSYVGVGARWMGGGFSDGLAFPGEPLRRSTPRQDYWGYTHSSEVRDCDIGFRVILDPSKDAELVKRKRVFDQRNKAWMIETTPPIGEMPPPVDD